MTKKQWAGVPEFSENTIIELESLYTPYTLDGYQTFNFERDEELIIDDLNNYDQAAGKERETPLDLSYDDIEWKYDVKGYQKALAENWVTLMNDNIIDDVILEVNSDAKVISPREYNFTTDKIFTEFTIDIEKLTAYIEANKSDYDENKLKSYDGFWWCGDENQTMLSYYINTVSIKEYNSDAYYYDQMEGVEASEYIEYTIKQSVLKN